MPDREIELRVRLTAKQAILLLNCVKDRAAEAVSYLRFVDHMVRRDTAGLTAWEELEGLVSAAINEAIEKDGQQGTFGTE